VKLRTRLFSSLVETALGAIAFTVFRFKIVTRRAQGAALAKFDCDNRGADLRLVPFFEEP